MAGSDSDSLCTSSQLELGNRKEVLDNYPQISSWILANLEGVILNILMEGYGAADICLEYGLSSKQGYIHIMHIMNDLYHMQ